jgi:integrase
MPAVLTGADVNVFLLRECARVSAGSAKGRVAELRSILRFLYLQGITTRRLGTAVPPVGGWRLASVPPPAMPAVEVQRLLDSVDRSNDVGVRNFAIITLIARLGLRSVEVARLELHDVDWRCGELVVRGKGRRQDRLPLPAEVGEALVQAARPAAHPGVEVRQVPVGYAVVQQTFRQLVDGAGIGQGAPSFFKSLCRTDSRPSPSSQLRWLWALPSWATQGAGRRVSTALPAVATGSWRFLRRGVGVHHR